MSRIAIAFIAFAIGAMPVRAQEIVSLTVQLDAAQGERLAGALVALVDATDRVLAESLSSQSGQVTLRAVPGQYRVRVRRIGYRPYYSNVISIPQAGRLLLRVESPRVVLSAMVVNAKAHCGPIHKDSEALAGVWEEIAKALKSRQLTMDDLSSIGLWTMYKREVGPGGGIVSADSTPLHRGTGRPFAAIDPDSLVRRGYVRGDIVNGWEYYGPDEAVLLSNGFAQTHCFRVVRSSRRKQDIGVAFDPVPGRRTADIKGVLWIDATTSELREITFQFVNVDVLGQFEPGGFTRFRRLPSGVWIVAEWQLRMPKLALRAGVGRSFGVIGYYENGGRVVQPLQDSTTVKH